MLPALEAMALRTALSARSDLPGNTFLTVNLGPDVIDTPQVREVLSAQPGLAGVIVELTEHARVDSYASLEPAIERLRDAGAMIAIDDAGSGYAGLQHLLSLRPDFLKLDRGLVAGLDRDEAKRTLVEMVGLLANRLDAWLLAEGVETRGELDCLSRLGVPLVQGYHLARPGPGWPQIDAETALHLLTSASLQGGRTVRSLLEATTVVSDQDPDPFSRFADDSVDFIVVTDAMSRPVAALTPERPLRSLADDIRVNLDTDVAEVAFRTLTRPHSHRFEPVVCIDNAGRYVGIVRVERLLHTLATARPQAGLEPS